MPQTNVLREEISTDDEDAMVDKTATALLSDYTITNEKLSIHIINKTGVSGLGNRLARYITNSGGNVISVSSSDDLTDSSSISCTKKDSYTCKRLSSVLQFDIQEGEQHGIADIEIIIGKKNLDKIPF